jgi:MFS superfamily sulfate permease-like transporter
LVSTVEALLFGVGVAFVIFGWRWLGADRSKLATAAFVAIAWTLVSWWPHDNFHRVSHDWYSLAAIEVGFHLTLIASIVIIALYFLRTLRAQAR